MSAARTRSRVVIPEEPPCTVDLARAIVATRDEWLAHGLCTSPADRLNAESAVSEIYARCGRRRPSFEWLPSPRSGVETVAALGVSTLAADVFASPSGQIAELVAAATKSMNARLRSRDMAWLEALTTTETTRLHPPDEAARAGAPPGHIIEATVWESLQASLIDSVVAPIRASLPGRIGVVTWYGQHEGHRFAHYDAFRRHGLTTFRSDDNHFLDIFAAVTASTGWWWALPDVCIMADRPTALHTESIPGSLHGERRLHHHGSPAIEFADGQQVFALHGTIVPQWVLDDPTVERIANEPNIEIRRCAIERLGWDGYLAAADLTLIHSAPDPGNPGQRLSLYSTPLAWLNGERLLLVENGSLERDGHRRRYGLHVPGDVSNALDAAGWTYGISGADYARLTRRT
ncbi:hypothetical protein M2359_003163 [Gordonia amarae]|nr:hypothetical protein [Gordonia amarae]MCS3879534.1 hypothetical protein [Gordonia amarae]